MYCECFQNIPRLTYSQCKFPNNYSSFKVVVLQAPDSKGINMMRVHTINLASGQGNFPDALHVDSTCFSTSFLLTLG